jgi:hemerythrin-like domain-containing protein
MKNPILTLLEEHGTISNAIEIARKVQLIEDDLSYRKLMHDLIIFFRNYTEMHHHPKEEDILYPLLRKKLENMSEEFIHEIFDNHEDFKSSIAEMENHYINYNSSRLRMSMDNYLDAYEKHIIEENKVVLKMAGDLISDEEKKNIHDLFLQLDEKNRISSKEELNELMNKISLSI